MHTDFRELHPLYTHHSDGPLIAKVMHGKNINLLAMSTLKGSPYAFGGKTFPHTELFGQKQFLIITISGIYMQCIAN